MFNAEFCLVSLKVICDDLLGHPLPLLARRVSNTPRRTMQATYAEHFDCPLHFAAKDNAFAFDSAGSINPCRWPMPSPTRPWPNVAASRTLEFTGRQAWLGRIRQLLSAQLNAAPGLEGLAEQMNCSARTLRRHLKDMGAAIRNCSMN